MGNRIGMACGALAVAGGLAAGAATPGAGVTARSSGSSPTFTNPGQITNSHVPLTKFRRCVFEGHEDDKRIRAVRTLLARTEPFAFGGGTVAAVVIEDRELEDGELVSRELGYFAQADDRTVYHFGTEVEDYEDGRVVQDPDSWRYGRETMQLGTVMPGRPRVGSSWRFEDIPRRPIEQRRIEGRLERARIGGRLYRDVLRVREQSRGETDVEHKYYARGIGLVRELPPDGAIDRVSCSRG